MNKYQRELYVIVLNQIQEGTTFNELVVRVLQHLRISKDELSGQVDRMDIRSAITRLGIHGAININKGNITHNLNDMTDDMTLTDYLHMLP